MMEGDEENSIDEFAFLYVLAGPKRVLCRETIDILRRAKERSQLISGKLNTPGAPADNAIEKIMEKLEKKSSTTSVKSPEKLTSTPKSPSKQNSRPILRQIDANDEYVPERTSHKVSLSGKKTVTTCDELTGDTIVEAKTFTPDETDMDAEDPTTDDDEVEDLPKDEDEPMEDEIEDVGEERRTNASTPKLSRTLKKLAEFHSKEEVDSPVHPHTPLETFNYGNGNTNCEDVVHVSASRRARSSRLSALAKTINDWEDDTTHHSIPGSRFHETNNSRASLAGKSKYSSAASPSASSPLSLGGKQGHITGELQGFSRRQGSPMKQIREKPVTEERDQRASPKFIQKNASPKKTYFGGSPSQGAAVVASPSKSPMKSVNPGSQVPVNKSPVKSASPVVSSPQKFISPVKSVTDISVARRSPSPVKSVSPVKPSRNSISPMKSVGVGSKTSSNESTPTAKPVSAIRMKFEAGAGNSGPPKPERSRAKPYSTPSNRPIQGYSKSPVKKFHFGEPDRDPATLSVAERAKLFESSNFCLAQKKPVVVDAQPKRAIFTSSPCIDSVKPQEIDVSCVNQVPFTRNETVTSAVRKPTPASPAARSSAYPPPPPPLPPMPTTSTPTNAKRRSTSPTRSCPPEAHSVKRIKVNAPKPGRIYPSLTDIDTETETEGHCSEVESMDDSLESQQSLGTEIETIAKACSPIRADYSAIGKPQQRYRPSEDFSATFACAAVDALIDEALEGQLDGTTMNCSSNTVLEVDKTVDASRKLRASIGTAILECAANSESQDEDNSGCSSLHQPVEDASYSEADTTASSSFSSSPVALPCYSALSAAKNLASQNTVEPEVSQKPESPQINYGRATETEEESFVPRQLMHTVSFYRKQQQQQKKTDTYAPLNDISEQAESTDESVEEAPVDKPNISQAIRKLEDEVDAHNLSIAQASKALNLCKALVGFSDSTEYIECERILLIESQKRMALLNSIHRLKTEGALSHQMPNVFSPSKQEVTPSCKGTMKISDISVTLRRDYFTGRRAENQFHFICLMRNKHHIDHTSLLTFESQKQGSTLKFRNEFMLGNLDPSFQVTMEIYFLESAKEFLPHEAKYRINAKKDSKHSTLLSPMLTPSKKGSKGGDTPSKLHSKPQFHSPAGPDTIKSSSFKFCGSLSIDISSLQRTYWELDKVSPGPLTGGVAIKVQCSAMGGVEHKGFLTLFEDVSGFGAWVRRWCRLGPAVLEFWKYPEDETQGKKPPLGTLNLHECVTSKVRPAPRDVCARANTLFLVTTRAPHPNDKDTLVTSCHKGYTAVRHLISADTREERDVWCHMLNKALANLRAWDPVAKQLVDDNLF
ncbi:Actin-binding protein anillin [Orchesella cincta]|uniref:Actin-binding protein anillin n=1 Tax=Orchesella cincta TaxID=48709 RepID=A0A1D2MUW7_ORCCI|nr:Actin-binding protein anillin [Orchesella cincta]